MGTKRNNGRAILDALEGGMKSIEFLAQETGLRIASVRARVQKLRALGYNITADGTGIYTWVR